MGKFTFTLLFIWLTLVYTALLGKWGMPYLQGEHASILASIVNPFHLFASSLQGFIVTSITAAALLAFVTLRLPLWLQARVIPQVPEFTVGMLVDSARAGRWLYN